MWVSGSSVVKWPSSVILTITSATKISVVHLHQVMIMVTTMLMMIFMGSVSRSWWQDISPQTVGSHGFSVILWSEVCLLVIQFLDCVIDFLPVLLFATRCKIISNIKIGKLIDCIHFQ